MFEGDGETWSLVKIGMLMVETVINSKHGSMLYVETGFAGCVVYVPDPDSSTRSWKRLQCVYHIRSVGEETLLDGWP